MILRQSVVLAVRALAFVTLEAQQAYFLVASEAFGMISLFRRHWWLWIFHRLDLLLDVFCLEQLSELEYTYL